MAPAMKENQANFQSFIVCLSIKLKLSKVDLKSKPVKDLPVPFILSAHLYSIF